MGSRSPDIDGSYIVWVDWESHGVHLYDLRTKSERVIGNAYGYPTVSRPRIRDNRVVWLKDEANLSVYNIDTSDTVTVYTTCCPTGWAIDHDRLVFDRPGMPDTVGDIIMHNLSTGTEVAVATGGESSSAGMGVSNRRHPDVHLHIEPAYMVAWDEWTSACSNCYSYTCCFDNSRIFYREVGIPGPAIQIPVQIAPGPHPNPIHFTQVNPVIGIRKGEPRIVWEDDRAEYLRFSVYYFDYYSQTEHVIPAQIKEWIADGFAPDIDGNFIVWVDDRYDKLGDIFLFDDTQDNYQYDGRVFRLTGDGAQTAPAVSGNYVVFQHEETGRQYGDPAADNNIYLIDLGALRRPPMLYIGYQLLTYMRDRAIWPATVVGVIPLLGIIVIRRIGRKYPSLCAEPSVPRWGRRSISLGLGSLAMLCSSVWIYLARPTHAPLLVLGGLIYGGGLACSYWVLSQLIPIISGYRRHARFRP